MADELVNDPNLGSLQGSETEISVPEVYDLVWQRLLKLIRLHGGNATIVPVVEPLPFAARDHRVWAGPDFLRHVLDIIINNAVDVLRDLDDDQEHHLHVELWTRDERLAIAITDDGPGIPTETQDRIFKKVVESNKPGGNGTGLLLTKVIIEHYKGEVDFKSPVEEDRGGATFTLRLPLLKG